MTDFLPAVPEALDVVADPGAFMVALVTQARALLDQANGLEGLGVAVEVKSRAEAIRVYTEQKNMGHEAELSAAEIVRRAERRIGELIRAGQDEGTIRRRGDRDVIANQWGSADRGDAVNSKAAPADFVAAPSEVYVLTDDVSPERFEQAITQAKSEGNLARANVVRKIIEAPSSPNSREAVTQRRQRIRQMAASGHRASQIAAEVGLNELTVRENCREMGVEIVAEKVAGKTRRIDSNRIVSEAAIALEAAVMGLDLVELDTLDTDQVESWATSFTNSLRSLNRFAKQLKEMTRGPQD